MTEQFKNEIEQLLMIFKIELPPTVAEKIIVLFKDKDKTNWNIENISYCFKDGEEECPFYKGYFYIPGFSRYVINSFGDLLVVRTGNIKKWTKTNGVPRKKILGGYMVSHAICDENVRRGISRHRALCLAFKHPLSHPGDLWVNHKNGKPGNDCLENLEFCTPGYNVKHAYATGLYQTRLVPVSLLNWITGDFYEFTGIQRCVEFLDKTEGFVNGRLRARNNKRYTDGWRIKYRQDAWLELDKYENHTENSVELICRNIFTGSVFIFGSIKQASNYTGVNQGTLISLTAKPNPLPFMGWDFRRLNDFEGWPNYTQKHLDIFKDYPRRVVDGIEVLDLQNNEMLFFTSAEKAGQYFGISPITASKLARYVQTKNNRFIFKLFRIRENLNGPSLE